MSEGDRGKDSIYEDPALAVPDDQAEDLDEADDGSDDDEIDDGVPPASGVGWPTGGRAPLNFKDISGGFNARSWTHVLLNMDGQRGRNDADAKAVAVDLKEAKLKGRSRNPHSVLEKCGVIRPGGQVTRLARLGRMLRDLSAENGLRKYVAREALDFLLRFQADNPEYGDTWPAGSRVHPYWIVLRAACDLDHRIHWDEVNRELMRILDDGEITDAVARILAARGQPGYGEFLGSEDNGPGHGLNARVHAAKPTTAQGKTPVGQLRDQRLTPFLKLAGFGELLLASPGRSGEGYWTVPPEVRDIVEAAVHVAPAHVEIHDKTEWIEWLYEGRTSPAAVTVAPRSDITPPHGGGAVVPVRDLTLGRIKASLAKHAPHLRYKDDLLAAVVASVRSGDGKNFIILRGVSGTGKTQLASAVASAVFDVPNPEYPQFQQIEVRPDWTDVTHLLGYHDPVKGKFMSPRFMKALEAANAEFLRNGAESAPVFVCLDEMNLAPIELYLADCLSLMESGRVLDRGADGGEAALPEIRWPPNLFLFGTVNVDETTAEISDKVLDRAQVIDTSDIEIGDVLAGWLSAATNLSASDRELVASTLSAVWDALRPIQRHFGFRTGKAVVRFVDEAIASSDGVLDAASALDAQIAQKILVKLRGEGEHWSMPLEMLKTAISGLPGSPKSLRIVDRMISDHDRLGSFQFWE